MTTADWADGVCTDINTWKSSTTTAAESLKGGNIPEESLKGAADDVTSATDTLESALDQLSSDLKTGSTPCSPSRVPHHARGQSRNSEAPIETVMTATMTRSETTGPISTTSVSMNFAPTNTSRTASPTSR